MFLGTLNSTENNIACIQPQLPGLTVTEDCLILNVWTPHPRPSNASVMVRIFLYELLIFILLFSLEPNPFNVIISDCTPRS